MHTCWIIGQLDITQYRNSIKGCMTILSPLMRTKGNRDMASMTKERSGMGYRAAISWKWVCPWLLSYLRFSSIAATPSRHKGSASNDTNPTNKRKRGSSPNHNASKEPRSKRRANDKEYGVSRGIDFINVACVLNFDLPTSYRVYKHRIGRTARAGHSGTSLSFIIPISEQGESKAVGCVENTQYDEMIWERIEKGEKAGGRSVQEFKFDMTQVEAFRYRMGDALRSVTKSAIKEARVKELKAEILSSEKLKVCIYFRVLKCVHFFFQGTFRGSST